MNMQHMHMDNPHKVFWLDDQVTVLFRSDIPFVSDGILNQEPLQQFSAPAQLKVLNGFLQEKGIRGYTLQLLDGGDHSGPDQPPPPPQGRSKRSSLANDLGLPPGIYPFSFATPIVLQQGEKISTSFVSFFRIEKSPSHIASGESAMEMPDSGDNGHSHARGGLVSRIVRTFNEHLDELNKDLIGAGQLPVTITSPTWLSGGTPVDGGQGCPLTPPIPVTDSCSNWHIRLPRLSSDLKSKKGDGVTVFILDSFPERGVIARAAREAEDDNRLLRRVNETVTFDYSFMSGIQDVLEMGETQGTFVGKDVYGRHYPILLADHGLFIAGIVRDVAPHARIECVRVLDDLCVGNVKVIANALWNIYLRKALRSGDLYGKPVVVNLSLVIPTDKEAKDASSGEVDTSIGGSENVWANLKEPLQGLRDLGVIVAASAGNEGDLRESPGINRPKALYPAAFAYAPYSVDNIIPVGAVNKHGDPASYSCYPGSLGVATYGGEVPKVTPPDPSNPPSDNIKVKISDAPRGIYSSVEYPPLLADPPEQYYTTPNDHAWAYWVGTSFATPILSALAARVLESNGGVPDILNAASDTTLWDRLDSSYSTSSTATGSMLRAVQRCVARDHDDEEDADEVEVEIEITEVTVTVHGSNR